MPWVGRNATLPAELAAGLVPAVDLLLPQPELLGQFGAAVVGEQLKGLQGPT
jgi:hypothetical protein